LPRGHLIKELGLEVQPEDFLVEELPLYEASGAGTHTYAFIEKRGIGTNQTDIFTKFIAQRLPKPVFGASCSSSCTLMRAIQTSIEDRMDTSSYLSVIKSLYRRRQFVKKFPIYRKISLNPAIKS